MIMLGSPGTPPLLDRDIAPRLLLVTDADDADIPAGLFFESPRQLAITWCEGVA
jgi:hypothetical protein